MKKISKVIIPSLIALLVIITVIPSANATVFSYKRATGVFNAYYDDSVAAKGYTTQFDWARSKWSGISSKVSIGKTNNATTSTDQYYVGTTFVPKLYGETNFFKKTGSYVDPNISNWDYSAVVIYHNNLVKDGLDNDTNMKNTVTHEVGHSLGLAHTNEINNTLKAFSIMTDGSDSFKNRNVTSPSDYDEGELKYKWGN